MIVMTIPTAADVTQIDVSRFNADQIEMLLEDARMPAELVPRLRERRKELQRRRDDHSLPGLLPP
jgi:hypothetical protein